MCERTSSQVQVNDPHIPNFEPSRKTWHISNSLAQEQKPVHYKLINELKHLINAITLPNITLSFNGIQTDN